MLDRRVNNMTFAFRESYFKRTPKAHPLTLCLWHLMKTNRTSMARVSEISGVFRQTITNWFRPNKATTPNVNNLDAALQSLGYKLVVVPIEWMPSDQYHSILTRDSAAAFAQRAQDMRD